MLNSLAIAPRPRIHATSEKQGETPTNAKPGVTRAEIIELFRPDFAAMNRKPANDVRV